MTTNYIITQHPADKMVIACSDNQYPEKREGNNKPGAGVPAKTNLYIGLVVITGLLLASCHKIYQRPAVVTPTVYAAGYEKNSSNIPVATLWTNGVATSLPDASNAGVATSMYVSGTDVYVTGNNQ